MYLSLAAEGDPLRAEARASLEALVAARGAARVRELAAQLNAAREKGDDAAVVVAGEAILALGGADWKTLVALGDAYANVDRPHDALVVYRRVVDGQPYEREWPRAQAAIRKLELRYTTAPGERDAVASARRMLETGSVREAREALDGAVQRSPFFEDGLVAAAEAWLARKGSDAYAVADDPRRALRLTEIVRLRNPQNVRANELRAEALLRTGAFRDALDLAVACIELDPVRPDPATTAGFALLALDDAAGALGRLQTSLDRRRTPRALYGRALAWEKLGHRQAARDEATILVENFGVPDELASEVRALLGRLDLEVEDRPR
jgi:tetratricopeptide (TPR) repeat protein